MTLSFLGALLVLALAITIFLILPFVLVLTVITVGDLFARFHKNH